MAKDGPGGWRIDPYGVERWWDGTKWQDARDRSHDVVTQPRRSVAASSSPVMPAASFARPPAERKPSPYARPATPAFYFPPTQTPVVVPTAKQAGVAYALAFPLGLLGIHRIYLDRTLSGVAMLLAAIANAVTVLVFGMLPVVGLAALGIWWVSDLFRVGGMVRKANARRFSAGF